MYFVAKISFLQINLRIVLSGKYLRDAMDETQQAEQDTNEPNAILHLFQLW